MVFSSEFFGQPKKAISYISYKCILGKMVNKRRIFGLISNLLLLGICLYYAHPLSGERMVTATWIHLFQLIDPHSLVRYLNNFTLSNTKDGGVVVVGNRFIPNSAKGAFLMGCCDSVLPREPAHIGQGVIIKIAQNGTIEWRKIVRPGFYRPDPFQTVDGGYIALTRNGVLKLDASGRLEWFKIFNDSGTYVLSIGPTSDGGSIVGLAPGRLVRLDRAGNVVWSKAYQSLSCSSGPDDLTPFIINIMPDGGFVLAGTIISCSQRREDVFLIQVDSAGNIKWSKTYSTGNFLYGLDSVTRTKDQGFVLSFSGIILKVDAGGNIEWYKAFDRVGPLLQTGDGGYPLPVTMET